MPATNLKSLRIFAAPCRSMYLRSIHFLGILLQCHARPVSRTRRANLLLAAVLVRGSVANFRMVRGGLSMLSRWSPTEPFFQQLIPRGWVDVGQVSRPIGRCRALFPRVTQSQPPPQRSATLPVPVSNLTCLGGTVKGTSPRLNVRRSRLVLRCWYRNPLNPMMFRKSFGFVANLKLRNCTSYWFTAC